MRAWPCEFGMLLTRNWLSGPASSMACLVRAASSRVIILTKACRFSLLTITDCTWPCLLKTALNSCSGTLSSMLDLWTYGPIEQWIWQWTYVTPPTNNVRLRTGDGIRMNSARSVIRHGKTHTFDVTIGNTRVELDPFLRGLRQVTVRAYAAVAAAMWTPLPVTLPSAAIGIVVGSRGGVQVSIPTGRAGA